MNATASRFFAADLAECIRLNDSQKAENAAARERMQTNIGLCDALLEDAHRRGQASIDWPEYFRNIGI